MTSISRRLAALPPDRRGELASRIAQAARTVAAEPIAVVGLGCRFPGGVTSPEEFWSLLVEGRDVVGEVPAHRWDADARGPAGEPVLRHGGFLDDPWGLDSEFFSITPREAAAMDPQQRLLLEVAWETAEHAGIPARGLSGSRTGVFLGLYYNEHLQAGLADPASVDAYTITGGLHSVAAGRLSYALGLRGPSLALDTACSSSLAAVHLACQSLRLRESDLAFAGGANLILGPELSLSLHRYGLLAPDGRCKTFDASADGIVRTEGCALLLLKRLGDALDDGDRVLAVLRGSGVNQDGRSNGLTAPSGTAQRDLLADTVARSGADPYALGFVEAHGTGTELGDPIEVEAIVSVYGGGDKGGLALGAVKTNLGHPEAAAGAAALMKAVLAVHHGVVPPNLHFERLNPKIELAGTRVFVPTEVTGWPVADGPRLAAASSFGMGGTNAHAIVEEPPPLAAEEDARPAGPHALLLSGASEQAARENADRLAAHLEAVAADPADVAHTLAHRRSHETHRIAVVGDDVPQLVSRLRAAARAEAAAYSTRGVVTPSAADGAVWVFSGHGSQWTGMGAALLREPAFAAVVDGLELVYREEAGIDLRAALTDTDLDSAGADRVQPLVHAVQVGLAAVLRAYGAVPAAVLGHSMGEIAAAAVAGALDRADAARLVLRRSKLLAEVAGKGAMAAVELPAEQAAERFRDLPVDVAVHSTGGSVVVSGSPEAVDAVVARCEGEGTPVRRVAADVAFHSGQMTSLADRLAAGVAGLRPNRPRLPVYGTVHDDPRLTPAYDARYWAANLRAPVRFSAAVGAAMEDGHRVFLELAPHGVVTRSVARIAAERGVTGVTAAAAQCRGEPAATALRAALAAMHCAGAPVDLGTLVPGGTLVDLPSYAWQHRHHGRPGPAAPAPRAGTSAARDPERWTHRLVWRRRAAQAPGTGQRALSGERWLLVGDDDAGTAAALARRLEEAGAQCALADEAAVADGHAAKWCADVDRVVHLGALAPAEEPDAQPAAVRRAVYGLLELARVLADRRPQARLHLVTRYGQAVDGHPQVSAGAAALWGLGSSLALDLPVTWGGAIDVDTADAGTAADLVVTELLAVRSTQAANEPQVAFRGPDRYVPRLVADRLPGDTVRLTPDGSHLLVGASGLLGPCLAHRLLAMGARHLVLISRSGPDADLVSRLTEAGAEVSAVAADVADADAMARLFARFGTDLPELHGVYNAALSGGYTETADLTKEAVADMLRPKVDGTLLLHRLSLAQPVRHFVLFSSTTALLGSRGLAHYAAANRFQDAFAHVRRAQGLPAHVINWGAWGSWMDTASYGGLMQESGMRGLDDEAAVGLLDRILADEQTQRVVVAADWPRLAAAYRSRTALPLLNELTGEESGGRPDAAPARERTAPGETLERMAAAPAARRRPLLRDHVRATVAEVMGFSDARELPTGERFFQIGMDSLMSVQAQQRLAAELACELAPAAVFNHPTVESLTDHLLSLLAPPPDGGPPGTAPRSAPPAPASGTGAPSEDELVRRLTEKLRSLS